MCKLKSRGWSFGLWAVACMVSVVALLIFTASPALAVEGADWEVASPLPTGNNLNGVVAGNGGLMVSVGDLGTVLTSPDGGVTWTAATSGTASHLRGVTWDGTRFVAVGSAGTILTSTNGVNWTFPTSGTASHLRGVTWVGTRFVAVGQSGILLVSPEKRGQGSS